MFEKKYNFFAIKLSKIFLNHNIDPSCQCYDFVNYFSRKITTILPNLT
jgi:hypothetical protein